MKNLAIIPARSGSKGVKDKNIRKINGQPLIFYTIDAAQKSKQFDEIIVSTDSMEYADIAIEYGASVPFLRSYDNSKDKSSSWDVVNEVLQWYREKGVFFDTFCLLQPTSPLRTSKDIVLAYEMLERLSASSIISVSEMEHPIEWCGKLDKTMSLDGFISNSDMVQRQTFDKYYRLNGAIYILNTEKYLEDPFLYKKGSYAYVMDTYHSIDIDTEMDFKIAEFLMKL